MSYGIWTSKLHSRVLNYFGLGLIGLGAMRLRRRKVKRTIKLDD